jgi:hypothetical protein
MRASRGAHANAFANAINQSRRDEPGDRRRKRKHRLGEGGKAVADRGEDFSPAEAVAERSGEDAYDHRRRFGEAFDDADGQHRRAQDGRKIERQKRVDHLGGDIHQERHDPERPHAGGDFAPAQERGP